MASLFFKFLFYIRCHQLIKKGLQNLCATFILFVTKYSAIKRKKDPHGDTHCGFILEDVSTANQDEFFTIRVFRFRTLLASCLIRQSDTEGRSQTVSILRPIQHKTHGYEKIYIFCFWWICSNSKRSFFLGGNLVIPVFLLKDHF